MTALSVGRPGLLTTIQDLGRAGQRSWGVPPSGAMDRFAAAAANLLVGNPEGAALLECTLTGPQLTAAEPCLVAVTGADMSPHLNGREVPGWTSLLMAAGDTLGFGRLRSGARAYIAVAGGLQGDAWLGSLSTYMPASKGGLEGRPLRAGDLIRCGPARATGIAGRTLGRDLRPSYGSQVTLCAVPGPHLGRLSPASRSALWRTSFQVAAEADRMGYRLDGPALDVRDQELLSFGLTTGSIQVPPSGHPIMLMADHQTAGGYPAVAGVGRAWLPLAAQLLPGAEVRFKQVTVSAAQAEWRRMQSTLDPLRGRLDGRVVG